MITLTLDQWEQQFRPLPNHLSKDQGCDFGNGSCLFETYGQDHEYIRTLNQNRSLCLWTLLEVDGKLFISEGCHFVNRLGYLVTERPYNPSEQYEINYSDD
jgi:hypothetical protein